MATTNLIPVYTGKDGSIIKTLRRVIGYVENPDKTEGSSRKVRDRDGEKPNKSEEEMIVSIPISKSFGDFNLVVKALKLSG